MSDCEYLKKYIFVLFCAIQIACRSGAKNVAPVNETKAQKKKENFRASGSCFFLFFARHPLRKAGAVSAAAVDIFVHSQPTKRRRGAEQRPFLIRHGIFIRAGRNALKGDDQQGYRVSPLSLFKCGAHGQQFGCSVSESALSFALWLLDARGASARPNQIMQQQKAAAIAAGVEY